MQLGPQYDLAARLTELEQRVARMETNGLGQAFSATQSDGSVGMQIVQNTEGSGSTGLFFYQGPNSPRDSSTGYHGLLMYVGELFIGGIPDDSGVIVERPDGSEQLVLGNRGVQIIDPKSNRVFGTDEYGSSAAQEGLTRPYIPLPPPGPNQVALWPATNAGSMTTIAQSQFIAQHPRVWWVGQFFADAATTGTVQMSITNGTTTIYGPTYSVSANMFGFTNDIVTIPSPFWNTGWTFQVSAEVTSGTGKVYCQTFNLYGIGNT